MANIFRAVTAPFANTLAACQWQSPEALILPTSPPITLRLCVGEGGKWALGTNPQNPRTMAKEVFDEVANLYAVGSDGTYVYTPGVPRALYDTDAGAALPGDPPPPPPPRSHDDSHDRELLKKPACVLLSDVSWGPQTSETGAHSECYKTRTCVLAGVGFGRGD